MGGFVCGSMTRGDIEDWLVEKNRDEVALQRRTLFWAMVAGWTGLAAVTITVAQWLLS